MDDFIGLLFISAGLLLFWVVFLIRRMLVGDRRTHAAVAEIEVNFAELKTRVEALSLRTAKLDEDNRRFRDAIHRLETAQVQAKPTIAVLTEPVVAAAVVELASAPVVMPAPVLVVVPAPAPVVKPAAPPFVVPAAPPAKPAAPPVAKPAASPVVMPAAPPVVVPVPAPVVERVAKPRETPPSPAHPSLAHRVLVQADTAQAPAKETTRRVVERRDEPPAVAAPERRTGEDWEALVGGNWLNKAGVIVFVIGLSLFLGYSLTQFGPLGRVAICWAVSIAFLGGGVVHERKPRYALYARCL